MFILESLVSRMDSLKNTTIKQSVHNHSTPSSPCPCKPNVKVQRFISSLISQNMTALQEETQAVELLQARPDNDDVHENPSVGVDRGGGCEVTRGEWRAILPLLWMGRGSAQGLH